MKKTILIFAVLLPVLVFSQRDINNSTRRCTDRGYPFPATDTLIVQLNNITGVFITGQNILEPSESVYYKLINLDTCEEIISSPQFGHFNWFYFRWDWYRLQNVTNTRLYRYRKVGNSLRTKALIHIQKP